MRKRVLYFVESQIPEFAGMARAQRQFLKDAALGMFAGKDRLLRWMPVTLCFTGAAIAAFSVAILWKAPAEDLPVYMFSFFAGVGLGGFLGGFVGNQLLFRKLRQHLRALIK